MHNAKDQPDTEIPGAEAYCRLSDREKDVELQRSLNRIYNMIATGDPDKEK